MNTDNGKITAVGLVDNRHLDSGDLELPDSIKRLMVENTLDGTIAMLNYYKALTLKQQVSIMRETEKGAKCFDTQLDELRSSINALANKVETMLRSNS